MKNQTLSIPHKSGVSGSSGKHCTIYIASGIWQDVGVLEEYQTQCIAVGDGVDYEKIPDNPVLDGKQVLLTSPQEMLPRELAVKNGRLIQNPVRELDNYHGHRVAYRDVLVTGETNMQGVSGRVLDMTVSVRPAGNSYRCFKLHIAKDGEQAASFIIYTPETADSISFEADGAVLIDVEKYDLELHKRGLPMVDLYQL